MLDKDKIILVFYINIDGIDNIYCTEYLNNARKSLTNGNDESIMSYIVPIKGENSKIECINPKVIDDKEYEHIIEKLNKAQDKLNEFLTENLKDNE